MRGADREDGVPRGLEVTGLLLPPWTDMGPAFPAELEPHPMARAFDAHWRGLCRAAGRIPPLSALRPAAIPAHLRGLFLIDIHAADRPGGLRFRYRLCGTEQAIRDGVDLTGQWVDEAHPTAWADAIETVYHEVMAAKRPHYWSRTIQRPGQEHQWIERVLVPISNDGAAIANLAGYVIWL
jgi:hypothetical protein